MFAIKEYYINRGRQIKINARLFAMTLPKVAPRSKVARMPEV